ncbi:rluB [Symbiodinium necroappetens]|uniref:RluB protein n=1 Tax=Symbiodinium necroappetens TaxID=1628268 RepID=A0A812KDN8_9DINO|nr:rluB [Symbiodinium necroappetens]
MEGMARTMYPGEVSPGGRSGRSHFSDADMSPVGRRGEKLHTLRSTGGFSTRPMSRIQSAPLLHAQQSPSVTTWYTNASQSTFGSPSNRRSWQPLASSFREWDEIRNMGVRDPTDKRDFANGLVPNWSKDNTMRMQGMLEHVLSWTYYHIQRDEEHPQRKEVGEYLDPQNVPVALRSGAARFKFWCDLKPPFQVVQVTRAEEALGKWREAVESEGVKPHPDGELFYVTYECPLAYHVERAWGLKTMAGTFDNKVHGVASVRDARLAQCHVIGIPLKALVLIGPFSTAADEFFGECRVFTRAMRPKTSLTASLALVAAWQSTTEALRSFSTYVLNKPRGIVSQRNDVLGRDSVYEIFHKLACEGRIPGPPPPPRVGAAGRLDKDTSGLIVLTDDRKLNSALTQSRTFSKRYEVTVKGHWTPQDDKFRKLTEPYRYHRIQTNSGNEYWTMPAKVNLLHHWREPVEPLVPPELGDRSKLLFELWEGRHHQIRRLINRSGSPISRLCLDQADIHGIHVRDGLRVEFAQPFRCAQLLQRAADIQHQSNTL